MSAIVVSRTSNEDACRTASTTISTTPVSLPGRHVLLIRDLLRAGLTGADHQLIADLAGLDDIDLEALHAFGVELRGDFSGELLAAFPLRESRNCCHQREHTHSRKLGHG